jgi:DNA-binding CsgD family transcriptional regulator
MMRWYGSPHVNEYRRGTGIDGFIISPRAAPHLRVSDLLALHHSWGEPSSEESQRRLVALVHAELGRLWEAVPVREPISGLAPRLRQVLERLRGGDAEKQVAARLGLSRHTVHTYVKDLHRRFAASSRGELLARSAPRSADFRPRLSRELV